MKPKSGDLIIIKTRYEEHHSYLNVPVIFLYEAQTVSGTQLYAVLNKHNIDFVSIKASDEIRVLSTI